MSEEPREPGARVRAWRKPPSWVLGVVLGGVLSGAGVAAPEELSREAPASLCPLVSYERLRILEDFELERDLAANEYAARSRVFGLVEELWKLRSVERDLYLDYKRLRDRSKVRVGQLELQIAQQKAIVKQYALACTKDERGNVSVDTARQLSELQRDYRRLDCEILDREWQMARIDLGYRDGVLEATRTLTQGKIKTRFELMVDEFERDQAKARADAYGRRAKACRESSGR